MEQPKTLSDALCSIYTSVGPDALKNSDRILGLFTDIAPKLKAERAQLEILVKSGALKTLAAAHGKSAADVSHAVAVASDGLCNTYFMEKSKANYLCRTYMNALSGKVYTPTSTTTANTAKPTTGSTASTAAPTSKTTPTNRPIQTSAQNAKKDTPVQTSTQKEKKDTPVQTSPLVKFLRIAYIVLLPFFLYFMIGSLIHGDTSSAFSLLCSIAIGVYFLWFAKKKKK